MRTHAIPGLAAAFLLSSAGAGIAQTVDTTLWVTNGVVHSVVHNEGTIYIGGAFTQVGLATRAGIGIDSSTGAARRPFPRVVGRIYSVAPDGSGGWYIGGAFTAVQGHPRANLAHVDAEGNVMPWNPSPNGTVFTMAVLNDTIYVGGLFTLIGGLFRSNIAGVDALGHATSYCDPSANGDVYSLAR